MVLKQSTAPASHSRARSPEVSVCLGLSTLASDVEEKDSDLMYISRETFLLVLWGYHAMSLLVLWVTMPCPSWFSGVTMPCAGV